MINGEERYIPIKVGEKTYKVWTQKFGSHPSVKILLLHGGPGGSHFSLKCFEENLGDEGFEFYYYDQLGSFMSDKPDDKSLWTIERFVDEVEQVRCALGLDAENFVLFGNSWGGILAMEYTLRYPQNVKGLVVSSMQASIKDNAKYVNDVLVPQLDEKSVKRIRELEAAGDYGSEEYSNLLGPFYGKFIVGMAMEEMPPPLQKFIGTLNEDLYGYMNGPSEFSISGTLSTWDIKDRLKEITVPSLFIGSTNNSMDPEQTRWMASEVKNGEYLHCEGSHFMMWNDPAHFFGGLVDFLRRNVS